MTEMKRIILEMGTGNDLHGGIRHDRVIGAVVLGRVHTALDHLNGTLAIGQFARNRLDIDLIRLRDADDHGQHHILALASEGRGHRQRVLLQRIVDGATSGLGIVLALQIDTYSKLDHHPFQRHSIPFPYQSPDCTRFGFQLTSAIPPPTKTRAMTMDQLNGSSRTIQLAETPNSGARKLNAVMSDAG